MADLVFQYSTSTAFASSVIRRLTHSPFSHVDLVLPGEGLLGVSGPDKYQTWTDPGGVLVRPFDPWPYLSPPKQAHLTVSDDVARKTIEAARSQIGKPFDHEALYAFIADIAKTGLRDWRDPAQWFCSELQIWAAEQGAVFPWPIVVAKNRVSPADSLLLFTPFLTNPTLFLINPTG